MLLAIIGGFLITTIFLFYYLGNKSNHIKYDSSLVIFITGCDSGYGHSLALYAASRGATVFAGVHGRISKIDESGIKSLESKNLSNLKLVDIDVTNEESISAAKKYILSTCEKESKQLSVVLNNAGVLVFAEAEWQTLNLMDLQFKVNTIGPVLISKAFLPNLRKRSGIYTPRIVNVVSSCKVCPFPTLAVYTATKAALQILSDSMRMELQKYGVALITFNPGDSIEKTRMGSYQSTHYSLMEKELNFESEPKVQKYFQACKNKFANLFPIPPVDSIKETDLYKTFDEIVLSINPVHFYINSDWISRSFYFILRLLPTVLSDRIRTGVMKLPKF